MLVIRKSQMEVFEEAAFDKFEDEMVVHSQQFTPPLCKVLGEEQLRVALGAAIQQAGLYGFTNRGPIRLFIEMGFLYGSGFDADPQYPWAGEILRRDEDQMDRADRLWHRIVDYQKKVSGQGGISTRRALEELLNLTHKPLTLAAEDFENGMRAEIGRIFPQKADYIGDVALLALVRKARVVARKHRLPAPRGEVLFVALMLAFGHGCAADPLYPWIEQTLADERIADSAARAERLEKKAVTWLEHVLAAPRGGVQA